MKLNPKMHIMLKDIAKEIRRLDALSGVHFIPFNWISKNIEDGSYCVSIPVGVVMFSDLEIHKKKTSESTFSYFPKGFKVNSLEILKQGLYSLFVSVYGNTYTGILTNTELAKCLSKNIDFVGGCRKACCPITRADALKYADELDCASEAIKSLIKKKRFTAMVNKANSKY